MSGNSSNTTTTNDRLHKFKAKNPRGKPCTWSGRNRLDMFAYKRAQARLQETPEYLEADQARKDEMLVEAERKEEVRRKEQGTHVSCMFYAYGKPIVPLEKEEEEEEGEGERRQVRKEEVA